MSFPTVSLRARFDRLQAEQTCLIVQGALAALAITPFAVWRWITGAWFQAAIDLGIVAVLAFFAVYGTLNKHFRLVSVLFVCCYMIGELVIILIVGPQTLYWAFPAQIAVFFVLRSHEALLIALLCLAGNSALAYRLTSPIETAHFIVTGLLVCTFAFIFSQRLTSDNRRLFQEATIDPLTGAGNRRHLDDNLARILGDRHRGPLSLMILDIDFFKSINDDLGHTIGDLCLQRFAEQVEGFLDPRQRLFRYGGEEFVILMEGSLEDAEQLAEKIRSGIESNPPIRGRSITVSIGIAALRRGCSARDTLRKADDALYQAKESGRNRVCITLENATPLAFDAMPA